MFESPCFGGAEGVSGRDWWRGTARRVWVWKVYAAEDFDRWSVGAQSCRGASRHQRDACSTAWRCASDSLIDAHRFRRVYQHFGSPKGYEVLPDAALFLERIPDAYLLGICSNTPNRHSSSVLPMLNIHERFKFFASSQDVGREKPDPEIFAEAFRQAQFWLPDLKRDEVLVGDSLGVRLLLAVGFKRARVAIPGACSMRFRPSTTLLP